VSISYSASLWSKYNLLEGENLQKLILFQCTHHMIVITICVLEPSPIHMLVGFEKYILGGCTVYYVWEPRAFMTHPKNPLVYKRLYV
jgi:hypothetical protein